MYFDNDNTYLFWMVICYFLANIADTVLNTTAFLCLNDELVASFFLRFYCFLKAELLLGSMIRVVVSTI